MNNFINKKTLKVAAIHLALSFIVWFRVPSDLAWLHIPQGFYFGYGALGNTELDFLYILQPSILLALVTNGPEILKGFFSAGLHNYLTIVFCVSMPIWSLCFGWIFVKFDNWLNHFPVLGKKVF
ncbi:MAG TPA: hypothetical protein VII71_02190 [Verrucomicrobiae bacterium]